MSTESLPFLRDAGNGQPEEGVVGQMSILERAQYCAAQQEELMSRLHSGFIAPIRNAIAYLAGEPPHLVECRVIRYARELVGIVGDLSVSQLAPGELYQLGCFIKKTTQDWRTVSAQKMGRKSFGRLYEYICILEEKGKQLRNYSTALEKHGES